MMKKFNGKYDPTYFLASLGNGGLAVTFFMYLMFMVKHPKTPMPLFEDIFSVLTGGNFYLSLMVVISLMGIIFFGVRNIIFLVWNINKYTKFRKNPEYPKFKTTNAEVSLMAIPLALAMSVNVMIISAVVFVPGIWNYVEYMFPVAIIIFTAIGIYALKIFSEYFSRIIINGDFEFDKNNNLSQMIAVFSFIMIAAGFSGPAAMSRIKDVSAIAMFLTIFFASIAMFVLIIKLVIGFKTILEKGIAKEGAPSFLVIIPILTILGIIIVRVSAGISHNFLHKEPNTIMLFIVLGAIISIQAIVAFIGYIIIKRTGYMNEFVHGENKSSGSYALICPGVAFMTLGMFFIHWGVVKNGMIGQFSIAYFILIIPMILVQLKTVTTLNRINKKHFA